MSWTRRDSNRIGTRPDLGRLGTRQGEAGAGAGTEPGRAGGGTGPGRVGAGTGSGRAGAETGPGREGAGTGPGQAGTGAEPGAEPEAVLAHSDTGEETGEESWAIGGCAHPYLALKAPKEASTWGIPSRSNSHDLDLIISSIRWATLQQTLGSPVV
ncbi:hypothetical protein Q8A73_021696 [Channa argus]|nr:hypothetical protein Q8A73_021696 [Channa argus]